MSKPDQEMLDFINELNQVLEEDDFGYLDNIIPDLPMKRCIEKTQSEFEVCIRCKDKFYQAEPNQPDGTFKCYSCRNY